MEWTKRNQSPYICAKYYAQLTKRMVEKTSTGKRNRMECSSWTRDLFEGSGPHESIQLLGLIFRWGAICWPIGYPSRRPSLVARPSRVKPERIKYNLVSWPRFPFFSLAFHYKAFEIKLKCNVKHDNTFFGACGTLDLEVLKIISSNFQSWSQMNAV